MAITFWRAMGNPFGITTKGSEEAEKFKRSGEGRLCGCGTSHSWTDEQYVGIARQWSDTVPSWTSNQFILPNWTS
jgi:hypothetical protein